MAKDIQPIERSIATPTSNVSAGNSFERLGAASSSLATIISDKLNEAQIGMEAKQGELDALSGKAPETLAPGFNKVTRAYNAAVSDTEARQQVLSAKEQISQAYAEATNPATFTAETPAVFRAKMQGIVEGTLEHTRDDNRAKVSLALEQMSGEASLNMLNHSIEFDNQQTIKNMSTEVDRLIRDRRNAAIEGNAGNVAAINEQLEKTLSDYGAMNATIDRSLPELRRKLEESAQVDNILGNFAQAVTDGTQAEMLSDLAHNKDKLPFNVWQEATKEVLALDATEQKLNLQARAFSKQTVVNGIDNGSISTTEQITNAPNLTPVDQLQLINQLEAHQRAEVKSQYSLISAQKNILQGNPGFNTAEQRNNLFAAARNEFEKQNGRPMNLAEMYQSINGTGAVPASGIPGVSLGSDVPQFNAQLTSQLTSKDPTQVMQAALIFNDAVNVKETPNLISLSGEALAIASNFNMLNLGNVDPLVLAEQVSKTTLDIKDPDIQTRSNRFTQLYTEKGDPKKLGTVFKQVFNTEYTPGVSDNAFGVFKETYREQFLLSDSDAAALNATKYLMRAWGTSQYFEAGMVGQPVPEKELAIANIGYAFDNQLAQKTQNVINQNKQAIQSDPNHPFKIEWADSNKEINLNAVSESDRVFKRLSGSKDTTLASQLFPASKPVVKINGQKTEIFLMPTAESRLGDRVQYGLYYHDKFGMAQPVPDQSSPNGIAMFSPVGLETLAPTVAQDKADKRIHDQVRKFVKAQAMQDWDNLMPGGRLAKLLEGLSPIDYRFNVGTPEQRADIFRRLKGGDDAMVEKIIRQRIQGNENASTAPAEAARADHVGIDAMQGGK